MKSFGLRSGLSGGLRRHPRLRLLGPDGKTTALDVSGLQFTRGMGKLFPPQPVATCLLDVAHGGGRDWRWRIRVGHHIVRRQSKVKAGPAAGFALCPDPSAVAMDDPLDDRESNARPFKLLALLQPLKH